MSGDDWQDDHPTRKGPQCLPCANCPHEALAGPLACQQCPHYRPGFEYYDEIPVPVYLLAPDPDAEIEERRLHVCPVCGISFIDRPNQVYCHRLCRKRAELKKRRELRKKQREAEERLRGCSPISKTKRDK